MADLINIKVSEFLYKILNVSSITSIISGEVYREAKPINNELENIVITTNFLNSSYDRGVQDGLCYVNCLVKKIDGEPNLARINTITELVLSLLQANENTGTNNFYYVVENMSIDTYFEQNTLTIIMIRLRININNN